MLATKTSPAGNLTATERGEVMVNDFSTNNDKSFDYGSSLSFSSHTRDVTDYLMQIGHMQVVMPKMVINTPWGTVPRNYLYKKSYAVRDARFLWDQFRKEDLCLYVPRLTT